MKGEKVNKLVFGYAEFKRYMGDFKMKTLVDVDFGVPKKGLVSLKIQIWESQDTTVSQVMNLDEVTQREGVEQGFLI